MTLLAQGESARSVWEIHRGHIVLLAAVGSLDVIASVTELLVAICAVAAVWSFSRRPAASHSWAVA